PGVSSIKRDQSKKFEQYYQCTGSASYNALTISQMPLISHTSTLPQNINELWNQMQPALSQNDVLDKVSIKEGSGILVTYRDSSKSGDLYFFTNDSDICLSLDERYCEGSTNLEVKDELIKTANSLF